MPSFRRFPPISIPAFLLVTSAVVAGCVQKNEPPEGNEAEATTNQPILPRPQPPLDRAALLSAVAEAASAKAAGEDLAEAGGALDGRQFEVRIRFGCRGASTDLANAWLGWTYDPKSRTLRVRAKPTISKDDPLIAGIADDEFESVEGFWIPRPWLLRAVCPANAAFKQPADANEAEGEPAAAEPKANKDRKAADETKADDAEAAQDPVPAAPRIGIAQFFSSDDARTRRRGARPYSAVKTLPEGTAIPSQGFNLVLSGRLRALAGRGVIECVSASADVPPECVISAEFQQVRIEHPDSRDVIAEWGPG